MICRECNEQLPLYVEGLLNEAEATAVERHLINCASCRSEELATRSLRDRLLASGDMPLETGLDQRVMDQILQEQVELTRRLKMKRRIQMFAGSAIAAALVVSLTWAALQYGPTKAAASDVIARGAQAASNLKSIYLKCRMRTLPGDNFQHLDPEREFVDVELWKQYGDPLKWMIKKPKRVALMDGKQAVSVIDDRYGIKFDGAPREAFDTGWLHRLAAVDRMLSSELAAITAAGYDVKVVHHDGADHQVTVQVDTKEKVSQYLRNKFLDSSDTCRVYTFDPETGRLRGAKFCCRSNNKEVVVLEIVKIEYNPVFDESVFQLEIPDNVVWFKEAERLPDNEKYEKMTPKEAAQAFFEACANRDWDEVGKFWPMGLTDELKRSFGGLEIIKLGEPFQAIPYGGWFVPYEIKFNNGEIHKWNLALRNDNPAKRYVVDGGL